MPSIASVDLADLGDLGEEASSLSESSDLQKARKLYAELQAMSMESTGSFEVGGSLVCFLSNLVDVALVHTFVYSKKQLARYLFSWSFRSSNSYSNSGNI
jgi:hypothetical protein